MAQDEWRLPPADMQLAQHEVHVWRATLDRPREIIDAFAETLSSDELQRADRFRFPLLRQRFIVGRGILRNILSRYLHTAPASLQFDYTAYGKPLLKGVSGQIALDFNLSHADGMAVYAIASHRLVGIDIEALHRSATTLEIAEQIFSPAELDALRSVVPEIRPTICVIGWTRKEAYIKAHGAGLSLPLTQLSVSLVPEQPPCLLHVAHDAGEASRWTLRDLTPGPGYVGTLAVEGGNWQCICWEYQG